MGGADKEAAVAEALTVARSPKDDGWKAETIARLAPSPVVADGNTAITRLKCPYERTFAGRTPPGDLGSDRKVEDPRLWSVSSVCRKPAHNPRCAGLMNSQLNTNGRLSDTHRAALSVRAAWTWARSTGSIGSHSRLPRLHG